MNKCLCCGKTISNNEGTWHKSCIKRFFGTESLPNFNLKELSNLFSDYQSPESIVPGVQKKVSLYLKKEGNKSLLTTKGYPSSYILKLSSDNYPQMVENEYLTMSLAKLCNIETVDFGLIKLVDGSFAYITKRIDRDGKKKIAMEDFCQLGEVLTENKYHSSYENVGKILAKYSDNIGLDYYKLFNIVLFSFIVGNSDMHLKNFSLYEKQGKYILAPSYDLINTLIITDDREELALPIEGKKLKFKKNNFINLANRYNLNSVQITRIFDNFEKKYPILIETINNSFLEDSLKKLYINIIDDRYERLFNAI